MEECYFLLKLQAKACNFTKSNTPPWVFFTFLKLYKWYQIVQSISYKPAIFFLFMNESNTTNYADETNFESEDNLTESNLKLKLNLYFLLSRFQELSRFVSYHIFYRHPEFLFH